ncbi:MAG: response regulator [Planctomycetota bacterium]|jgi:CheY-like chemotaxis protein
MEEIQSQSMSIKIRKDIVILVVEDDHGHYLLVRHCLQNAGAENEIVWLKDGQEALSHLFDNELPSDSAKKYLMLLDIRMPKVDGIEVLKKMKQDTKTREIPVIMLTTSEDQKVAQKCYDLGCAAHVIKPPGDVLIRAIQRVCERY